MGKVAMLGMGAMGSRVAARLIDAGYDVRVWSRNASKADALVGRGASRADTPRAAAADADYVIAMVRDDEASRSVWLDPRQGALDAVRPEALAIESSTLSYHWTVDLGAAARARSIRLIDAPVAGSRVQAETGKLIYLAGGTQEAFKNVQPLLLSIGSSALHVGAYGSGMLAKLCTNVSLGVQTAMLAELCAMLRAQNVDPAPILAAVAQTPVWSQAASRCLTSMIGRSFEPQFPTALMEKDLHYASALAAPARMPTIAGATDLYRDAIAKNLGSSNFTSVAVALDHSARQAKP